MSRRPYWLRGRRLGIALIVLVFVVWELAVDLRIVTSPNWPAVSDILYAGVGATRDGEVFVALANTLFRTVAGFVLGAIAAVALGMLMVSSSFIRRMLEPTIELLRPMPVPALIPPLILLLGSGDTMKVSTVAFAVFFPVLVNTVQGGLSVEPTYRGVAATFGFSRFATTLKVILPATLPYVFAGLRISLAFALIICVVAEMIAGGSEDSMGLYIVYTQYAGRVGEMYFAVFLIGLCGYAINRLFLMIEQTLLFWHHVKT
jgi:NitT/TauT family transport system permease protein/sulfonate transport system permease protein